MWKLTPLTSGLYNVQHGVCQFALAPLPIPHSRIVRSDFFPLGVCQVRRVRLALLLSSCYYNTSILQRQVLVLPHIHIQHSMEVNEDDFASAAPPITPIRRPTGAHQRSAAHRRKSQFTRVLHPFRPTVHKIAPNGKRSLVIVRNVVYNRNRIPW